MRAAVITAPGQLDIREVPIPEPGHGEVRLRVLGCGVCASNLGPWAGLPWMKYPMGPGEGGHEAWGFVDAIGPGVTGVAAGDRVAALCYRAYAEYDVAAADTVVPLPPALEGLPFPGEAFGCAMNIFRRSRITRGDTVAVVGAGFLGVALTALAAREGARVIALSRRPFARDLAHRMGAWHVIPMDDHPRIIQRVESLTDGRLCDRVIEAAGHQWPLDLAAELTRVRGTLVIAGYHQDGPRQVNMQLWNWRGLDVINAHERDPRAYVEGIHAAVGATVGGVLDPQTLCTHRFPLNALGEALDHTAGRPDGFLKAVIEP
jgi:threonine dehydrogenase-like Zn-dependent dehydrogenase